MTLLKKNAGIVGADVGLGISHLGDTDLGGDDSTTYGTATLFMGYIDAWELNEETLKLTAVSIMSAWSQTTLNLHSPSCRWKKFKDASTCKYAGDETWCDRTYSHCLVLENTANFGGFRWIPSIVDKTIWWGRVPKAGES